jgi:DNA-binding LytR/AlgR family response regulator
MEENKISCIAIDDEPLALLQVESYIKKTPFLELAGSFASAVEARNFLVNRRVDAIFVDINMPDLNGLDFVRSIQSSSPLVVFTTAYSEYAIEGYKVDAIDYLLKPFSLEDFQRAASKIKNQVELLQKAGQEKLAPAEVSVVDKDESIYLKMDYKIVKLRLADIRYVEGMSEYLKIYTEGQSRPLVVLLSMKKMEERLQGLGFMRVHKSYIVNLDKVKEVSKNRIVMEPAAFQADRQNTDKTGKLSQSGFVSDDDPQIPVGESYRDAFQAYIDSRFL